ncbi:large subunit of N,N-dimethylformamidase [Hyaloraphidium curvatum]|nr:large subunit of N,N-dimethylformamidase [Hyaloraphidium curvatum]
MSATKPAIAAYPSHLFARPGDRVTFHVHAAPSGPVDAGLVRIGTGRGAPVGGITDAIDALPIDAPFAGTISVAAQPQHIGNYGVARLALPFPLDSRALGCAVFPTRPRRAQTVLGVADSRTGAGLYIELDDEGGPCVVDGSGKALLALRRPLPELRWTLLAATYDASSGTLHLLAIHGAEGPAEKEVEDRATASVRLAPLAADRLAIAARSRTFGPSPTFSNHFDGKIEAPRLFPGAVTCENVVQAVLQPQPPADAGGAGWWDFSVGIGTRAFKDLGPHAWDGEFFNWPARAVKGIHYDSSTQRWSDKPELYAAAQFSSDDQYDMEWAPAAEWTVPADLPSGAYAATFSRGGQTAYAVVLVEPADRPCTPVVFLAPTFTYLAYANETVHVGLDKTLLNKGGPPSPVVQKLYDNRAWGRSLYEFHADGTGTRHSSWLRPVANISPDSRNWAFPSDVAILRWLAREAPGHDLLTDHALHLRGAAALAGARVVVTGTHPEYYSDEMLDALEGFLAGGGRLMYMGGNGFYWRTGYSPSWPAAVELRRAEDGTRAWPEEPGEYFHESDGRLGGLWRRNGRPPNRLCGIGFAAQGFDKSSYYRRMPGADDPRAAFAMQGVKEEIIGDFGRIGGGAAGEEIDRFDRYLGSPAHALVLASSENHGPAMLRVKEEFLASRPHSERDPDVRADMVFFETPGGGAVFSTGSIAWAGALDYRGYDNEVARITRNVLRRFADPEPFAFPEGPRPPMPKRSRL